MSGHLRINYPFPVIVLILSDLFCKLSLYLFDTKTSMTVLLLIKIIFSQVLTVVSVTHKKWPFNRKSGFRNNLSNCNLIFSLPNSCVPVFFYFSPPFRYLRTPLIYCSIGNLGHWNSSACMFNTAKIQLKTPF